MKKALVLLLTAAAVFYLIFILRTSFEVQGRRTFTLIDDAMVSMRYARHLASGQGLVWNIDEKPVQGFTNPGWTFYMAFLHLFPLDGSSLSLAVMLTGAAILLANCAVVYRICELLEPGSNHAPLIAASMTAFYFPLVFWTLRGLEAGALTLAIDLGLWLALRVARGDRQQLHPALTVTLVLALLLRMDAALQVGLLLIYVWSRNPRKAWMPAVLSLLTLAAILILQQVYFGDFLPNTYYLKIIGVNTSERVRVGLLALVDYAGRDLLMPLLFSVLGLYLYRNLRTRESLLLMGLCLVQVGYSAWVGGDYAEELVNSANRFILQGVPALIILFSLVLDRFIEGAARTPARSSPALAVLIALGALAVISGQPWVRWSADNAPMLRTDIQRLKLGLHIKENTDPAAVIAVHAAGQIPYYSERRTIDLLGKNDPVIAKGPPAAAFAPGHNKWNYEYSILLLKPDVIADNFNKLQSFMQDQPEYLRLPNGIYVRRDSTRVDVDGLSRDYK